MRDGDSRDVLGRGIIMEAGGCLLLFKCDASPASLLSCPLGPCRCFEKHLQMLRPGWQRGLGGVVARLSPWPSRSRSNLPREGSDSQPAEASRKARVACMRPGASPVCCTWYMNYLGQRISACLDLRHSSENASSLLALVF